MKTKRPKTTKNFPFAVRAVSDDSTYLDAHLLAVSLYLGIAQFAKRRSCQAKNSLQISMGGQLAAKVLVY